jgi:uncharacterized membrane protein
MFQLVADIVIILNIPVVRQVIGFIYLTFVIGLTLLKVLKLNELNFTQTMIFSASFSFFILMFLGLLINTLSPIIRLQKPLSFSYLLLTINCLIGIFCFVSIAKKITFSSWTLITKHQLCTVIFTILPILSILGTLAVNNGQGNFILLAFICLICVALATYMLLAEKKSIFNPLILFMIAISLFLPFSLVTNYIVGNDIFIEFYVFKVTNDSLYWNQIMPASHIGIKKINGMISVTILPTIYSQILNIDGNFVFKFLYPFVLSLVVVAIYELYCTQFDKKTAFLSIFFFTTNFVVFNLFSCRQIVAELFYALIFLLFFNKNLSATKRNICYFIFSFALIISHYSMAYILLFLLFSVWLLNHILKLEKLVSASLIIFTFVLTFTWYIFISSAAAFYDFIDTIYSIYNSLYSDFFSPNARDPLVSQALGSIRAYSIWHFVGKIIFYISELLISLGFIMLIRKRGKTPSLNFKILLFCNMLILFMCIILPHFSRALRVNRFYQIALIIISPSCIIGGKSILSYISKKFFKKYFATLFTVLFLIPFFLFQSEFIYVINGVRSWSIPLTLDRGDFENQQLYQQIVYAEEVLAAEWLNRKTLAKLQSDCLIYADSLMLDHVLTAYGLFPPNVKRALTNVTIPDRFSYIYAGRLNVIKGVFIGYGGATNWNVNDFSPLFEELDKIYCNGASDIYCKESP